MKKPKGKKKGKLEKVIKLQIAAGKATPAPPVGPALGAVGLNIMSFCSEFNGKTSGQSDILPVEISVYSDKSFTFIIKQPPTSELIKKACGITKGSSEPNRTKVGKLTREMLISIFERKKSDMRVNSLESGLRVIAGVAKSMGVEVECEEK